MYKKSSYIKYQNPFVKHYGQGICCEREFIQLFGVKSMAEFFDRLEKNHSSINIYVYPDLTGIACFEKPTESEIV